MPDPQTNRPRTWLGASLMTALSGDSGGDSGELRRTRPLLRGLGWSSSSSSFGARPLFRAADSLIGLSSAPAGARAALRFLAADFLGAVAMGTAIMSIFDMEIRKFFILLACGGVVCVYYIPISPTILVGPFQSWTLANLSLKSAKR